MKQYFEWTDEIAAMKDALNTISYMILDLNVVEITAAHEAKSNIEGIKKNLFTKDELIDRLQQAVIDFNVNKKGNTNV